ncbi:hypothetical protein BS78_05G073500 [Paspalum vaginatum]|nr:hypothetical protein BS78_05G073500 [Paspalum vaginatum]
MRCPSPGPEPPLSPSATLPLPLVGAGGWRRRAAPRGETRATPHLPCPPAPRPGRAPAGWPPAHPPPACRSFVWGRRLRPSRSLGVVLLYGRSCRQGVQRIAQLTIAVLII